MKHILNISIQSLLENVSTEKLKIYGLSRIYRCAASVTNSNLTNTKFCFGNGIEIKTVVNVHYYFFSFSFDFNTEFHDVDISALIDSSSCNLKLKRLEVTGIGTMNVVVDTGYGDFIDGIVGSVLETWLENHKSMIENKINQEIKIHLNNEFFKFNYCKMIEN